MDKNYGYFGNGLEGYAHYITSIRRNRVQKTLRDNLEYDDKETYACKNNDPYVPCNEYWYIRLFVNDTKHNKEYLTDDFNVSTDFKLAKKFKTKQEAESIIDELKLHEYGAYVIGERKV